MTNYMNSEHVGIERLRPAPRISVSENFAGHGLGDWMTDVWNTLTGKPQSWYTNVSNLQNSLITLVAGITAVGADVWNFVSQQAAAATSGGTPSPQIDDYDTSVAAVNGATTSIVVTQSSVPTDDQISAAQSILSDYQAQLNYVTSVAPDVQAQVQADQSQVQSSLPAPMQSPSAVGQAVFTQEVAARASAITTAFSFGTGLALAAGGLFLLWWFFGRGRG